MQRFAIACTLVFFCGSVSIANNFTPIINRPSQPMELTPKGKLAEEQTKCWCMGSRPPPICTLVTLCQRQVVFAPGRAIKGASRRAANNGPEVRSSHLCHITR
jgi:hypothetical protein